MHMGIFIKAVLNKKISPYGDVKKDGIAGLLFHREQIREYARELRQVRRGNYCCKDLLRVLGFSTVYPIRFLIHKGVIKAEKRVGVNYSEWLINQKAVDSFKKKYVLPATVAERFGTSGAFLSELLIRNGVRPVSGPRVDGGRQYIFSKADVEQLDLSVLISKARLEEIQRNKKLEIIDAKCAMDILGVNSMVLSQLIERGVLSPSTTKKRKRGSKFLFNLFHIERLKNTSIDYFNIISVSSAARMVGKTYHAFQASQVRSARIQIACHYNGKSYLRLKDVEEFRLNI